jgi:dienelactone hydrolase
MRARPQLLGLFVTCVACAHPVPQPGPQPLPEGAQLVTFDAGDGKALHGFFYLPAGDGPFPAVLWNHGSEKLPGWQPELAAFYTSHGYAFFIPHRRGQGKSSDAGPYIMDEQPSGPRWVLDRANAEKEVVALHEQAAKDVDAALAWLKTQPKIDPQRIVMSGVSFGGIQTMLAAERGQGVRAFVAFAPGAMSWAQIGALAERMQHAAEHAQGPVLVVQAKNDFDLAPTNVLGPILERTKHGRAVQFPAYGSTPQEGHGAFSRQQAAIEVWGPTVLAFFQAAK